MLSTEKQKPAVGSSGSRSKEAQGSAISTVTACSTNADLTTPASQRIWGATSSEWAHFDFILGLTNDLLPVVSNPQARISPDSKMKEKGKTPSQYNSNRMVAGFPGWTSYHAGAIDLAKWSANPDYGICVQTRRVRAIDVDVTDAHVAERLREFIIAQLGYCPPVRRRSNSSKFLMTVAIPGEFGKRKVLVPGGAVEILATGQQFIAVGTHPSGVPYSWEGGLPDDIPEITMAQFEELWGAMVAEFALEPPTESRASKAVVRQPGELYDPVAEYLEEKGWMHDAAADGRVFIRCPFEDEHTSASGGSDTTYFTRGTGGYDQGHFKCLHAHCTGREDHEFLEGIGFLQDQIPDLPVVAGEAETLPNFSRYGAGRKQGKVESNLNNLTVALSRPDICGLHLGFDEFRGDIVFARQPGEWQPMLDTTQTWLRRELSNGPNGFDEIPKDLMRDSLWLVATEALKFDSAQVWLEKLQWDGEERIERALSTYFGTEDNEYTRAVGLYLWTALAGRVLKPGIKADMVPVAVGAQGARKSSTIKAISPSEEFFAELDLSSKDDDLFRRMRGKLVIELDELRGLRTRATESVKSTITRTHDGWIPKFQEMEVQYARRCVFIGSTNADEFLTDDSGNRRWLPFRVGQCNPVAMVNDREQLWAEARDRFILDGIHWEAAERLGAKEHQDYVVIDAWQEAVQRWLESPDMDGKRPGDEPITAVAALQFAVGLDTRMIDERNKLRMVGVLKALGRIKVDARINGKRVKAWAQA
jgi:hypothetical protein